MIAAEHHTAPAVFKSRLKGAFSGGEWLKRGLATLLPALPPLLLALIVSGCSSDASEQQAAPPPPPVSVAQVLTREVNQWDEFTGRVEATKAVEIRPRVAGYIQAVPYTEGQEVRKGDALFVIDQRPYRAELARAQAELARARAQSELARSEIARARRLVEARFISEEALDQRIAAETQSEAGIRAAEAAVEIARLNLEFTEVRSPINGRAGQALVTEGNLVSTQPDATLLTTVVSLDPVYVYFEGDEQIYLRSADLARRGARNRVLVGLANEEGFPHEGHMDFVDNQVNPATGTIRGRAVVRNQNRVFTPGLFARVKLVSNGAFEALLVDDKAILTDQDRKYVYVLGPENRAVRRDVKLGRTLGGLRVVTEGLTASDQVIVHGVQKVFFPGMPVTPQKIAMGAPPPGPAQPGAQPGGPERVDKNGKEPHS